MKTKEIYVVVINSTIHGFVRSGVALNESDAFALGNTMIDTLVKVDDYDKSDLCCLVNKFVV